MKRSSFFKSLATLVAAPSLLAKVSIKNSPLAPPVVNSGLFKDMQLVMPEYYKELVEKYGNENFAWWMDSFGRSNPTQKFFHFEKEKTILNA